jgi:hypothetical protein
MIACDEKRLAYRDAEEMSLKDFEAQMKGLSTKGYAYDERALWRRLGESAFMQAWRKDMAEIDLILEGCRNLERQLNMVKETFRLEAKLSYEGHS